MADDAKADTHPSPPRAIRTAVDRVAGLAHLAKRDVIERLENPHGEYGRGVTFIANVRFDSQQHVRPALVARVAVEAGDLLFLALKGHARQQSMLVMGVDGRVPEYLLVVMAFSAERIFFAPGHLGNAAWRFARRVGGMS